MTQPPDLSAVIDRFHAYYLATRPDMRELDPVFVRRICAETIMARQRRGKPVPFREPPPTPTRVPAGIHGARAMTFEPDWRTIRWCVDRHVEAMYRQRPEVKAIDPLALRRAVARTVLEDLRRPLGANR